MKSIISSLEPAWEYAADWELVSKNSGTASRLPLQRTSAGKPVEFLQLSFLAQRIRPALPPAFHSRFRFPPLMRVAGKSGPGLTEATNIFPGIYDVEGYLTRLTHLQDAVAALDVTLSPEHMARLEAGYIPHHVAGPE